MAEELQWNMSDDIVTLQYLNDSLEPAGTFTVFYNPKDCWTDCETSPSMSVLIIYGEE